MKPADVALRMLREGNERFVSGNPKPQLSAEERTSAAREQRPWAAVIGCSDSRVPVESVFDAGPGELFVVRSAGHVMSEAGYASIQYAVEMLGTRLIVVLGHEGCGAVTAARDGQTPGWLSPITQHIRVTPGATLAQAVNEHARESVGEMRAYLAEHGFAADDPLVVGAAYQLGSGRVHWL